MTPTPCCGIEPALEQYLDWYWYSCEICHSWSASEKSREAALKAWNGSSHETHETCTCPLLVGGGGAINHTPDCAESNGLYKDLKP